MRISGIVTFWFLLFCADFFYKFILRIEGIGNVSSVCPYRFILLLPCLSCSSSDPITALSEDNILLSPGTLSLMLLRRWSAQAPDIPPLRLYPTLLAKIPEHLALPHFPVPDRSLLFFPYNTFHMYISTDNIVYFSTWYVFPVSPVHDGHYYS